MASLRQQLKARQRELTASRRTNDQLLRKMSKMDERLQSMMKLQKLIADRQIRELHDDRGAKSELVASTRPSTTSEQSHVTRLKSVRRHLSQRLDAQSTAALMFQRGAITLRELQAIQNSNKEPIKAAEKLIDVVIGQPYEVYESFVETFKEPNRPDILEIIASGTFPDHTSMTGHALQIRQHYVYLLDVLDTKYSGLLGELFSTKVLSSREKSEIGQESSSYRQNELLLSALCYKPEDSYDKFLTALDKTDQGHVRNALTGRTEQEQQQAEAAYDDTDSTPHMTESAEVQQLRHQLHQLTVELNQLRDTKASLEQQLKIRTHPYQNVAMAPDNTPKPTTASKVGERRTEQINPQFVTALEVEDTVVGVAELDGIIYTVCHGSDTVRAHSLEQSVGRHKDVVVRGLSDACDLVACLKTRRLHVADHQGIWVVSASLHSKVHNRINTSPVRPHSLSVREGHVLVTSQHSKQLVQYSDDLQEVGRVSLPGNMTLHHAAMTSRGTFVVCCNTTRRSVSEDNHQVVEVGRDGRTLQSFGGGDQLKWPWYVVINEHTDDCLIADRNHYRVLQLGPDLRPASVVIDSPQGPSRLCLTTHLLLVAEANHVNVFTLR